MFSFRRNSRVRITSGPYVGEIVHDPEKSPALFHWIVQYRNDAEILYWGQETTEEAAVRSVNAALDQLTSVLGQNLRPAYQAS